ncbi:hypothetical protein [Vitreimonas flagellata]|uniref:hypothetical protein n=1 Tax=Vitreimonas flagellata TaxID=2560861 RepID=UPI001074BA67|nr:hypothetical protein [Vitreimonas flagellata]
MSFALPLFGLAIAAALFFVAQRFGWRGVAFAAGAPLALMIWLWLALKFYWIDHTGDDDTDAMLFLVIVWFVFASVVSALGLAFHKRR